MKIYGESEAKMRFSSILESAVAGDEVIITKSGEPVAKIIPFSKSGRGNRIGLMRGKIQIGKGFTIWDAEEAKALEIAD